MTVAYDDDDGSFSYSIANNRKDAHYADAFCGSGTTVSVNRKAEYTITSSDGGVFMLQEFTFEFKGAAVVTVDLVTDATRAIRLRVSDSAYKRHTIRTYVEQIMLSLHGRYRTVILLVHVYSESIQIYFDITSTLKLVANRNIKRNKLVCASSI